MLNTVHSSGRIAPLTIGLPVFNGERFLRQALTSLLSQSYRDFTLLISDNASTDSTPAICREFAAGDSRVVYIRHDVNRGICWNFQYVVEQAKTPLFMFGADDDLWDIHWTQTLMEHIDSGAKIAFGRCLLMDEDGNEIVAFPDGQWSRWPLWRSLQYFLGCEATGGKSCLVYGIFHREALVRFPVTRYQAWGGDFLWGFDLLQGYHCVVDPRVTLHKRVSAWKGEARISRLLMVWRHFQLSLQQVTRAHSPLLKLVLAGAFPLKLSLLAMRACRLALKSRRRPVPVGNSAVKAIASKAA